MRRGFTFVELAVTLTIISVLTAILFPVFVRAPEKGRMTTCLSNLHSIGAAMRMYAAENYGHLPPRDNDLAALCPKYLPDARVLTCPSVRERRPVAYPPAAPLERGADSGRTIDGPPRTPYVPPELPRPYAAIPSPGLMFDYVYRGGLCDDDSPDEAVMADDIAHRHNGEANYLLISGSAKLVPDTFTQGQATGGWATADSLKRLHELRAVKAGQPMPTFYGPVVPPRGGQE